MSICCFCCPQRTWCYTRWQSVFDCSAGTFSAPTSAGRTCVASPTYATWTKTADSGTACTYQIDIKGKCCNAGGDCTADSDPPAMPASHSDCGCTTPPVTCGPCDHTTLSVTGTTPLVGSVPTIGGDPCGPFDDSDALYDCDGGTGVTVTQAEAGACSYHFIAANSDYCFYGRKIRQVDLVCVEAVGTVPQHWELRIGSGFLSGNMLWIGWLVNSASPVGTYTKINPCYSPSTYAVS